MSRIIIELTRNEMEALKQNAKKDLRQPRDQVRHILRCVLLNETPTPVPANTNTHADREAVTVGAGT